ncbi:MAG: hypothetical protein ACE5FP_09965, partial [Gemmatimonadota bacterium]
AVGQALRMAEADAAHADEGWDFVRTALTGSATDRFAAAARFPVSGSRGPFSITLDRVEEVLRECITNRVDSVDFAWHSDVGARLPGIRGVSPDQLLSALDRVEQARTAAAGNGNPQAIAFVLLSDLARELRVRAVVARNEGSGRG